MEKSKTLFTEDEIDKKAEHIFGVLIQVFTLLFSTFVYLAIIFSMITSIYYLLSVNLWGMAGAGYIIFKCFFFFFACLFIILIAKEIWVLHHKRKLRFKEYKEKLKQELIKEIKNGRRISKARQSRKKSS